MKYHIEVIEDVILSRVVKVRAKDRAKAISRAREMYYSSEIELNISDEHEVMVKISSKPLFNSPPLKKSSLTKSVSRSGSMRSLLSEITSGEE